MSQHHDIAGRLEKDVRNLRSPRQKVDTLAGLYPELQA